MRIDPARPGSVVLGAVLTGIVAGLFAATMLTVTAEPSIEEAIKLEQAHAAPDAAHEKEIVSRRVQKSVGLFGAYALAGAGFGLFFAAAYMGFKKPYVTGAVLGGALTVAPWLKYPPNPPAVGDPATIHKRQLLYLTVIAVAFVVGIGAVFLSRRLRTLGWNDQRRVAAVVVAVSGAMLVAFAALPPPPDPVEVSATLIWRFRLASLGGNLALWTALTLGFSLLVGQHQKAALAV